VIHKNKKGQLGKIITIIPLMIWIFIVMGLFIFLSASFSLAKTKSTTFISGVGPGDDAMLKTIKIDYGGKEQDMRVIEAIAWCIREKCTRGDELHGAIAKALMGLTSSDKVFFVFEHEQDTLPRYADFYITGQGDCTGASCGEDVTTPYQTRMISVASGNGKLYLSYYLGAIK
jgi:hypothetical protein